MPEPSTNTVDVKHVRLSSAEAAVLACEKRMGEAQHAVASRWPILAQWAAGGTIEAHELVTDLRDALDFLGGENAGMWPDQSAQHAVLLEQIKTVHAETVAEIVEALREHDGRKPLGGAWVNSWARNAVADWIESRFAAKEAEAREQQVLDRLRDPAFVNAPEVHISGGLAYSTLTGEPIRV